MNNYVPVRGNAKLIIHVQNRGICFCASIIDGITNLMFTEPCDEILIIKNYFNLNDYECFASLVRTHTHILWSVIDERFLSSDFLLSLIKTKQVKYVKI